MGRRYFIPRQKSGNISNLSKTYADFGMDCDCEYSKIRNENNLLKAI